MRNLTLGLLVALMIGGCVYDDHHGYRGGGAQADCSKFVTCNGCTRAVGCGWCFSGEFGRCASSPNHCAGATAFSWTWEFPGCPGASDASTPADGWTSEVPRGIPPAADAPVVPDVRDAFPPAADAPVESVASDASDAE